MATIKSRGLGGARSLDRARLLVRLAIEPMTATMTNKEVAPLHLRLLGAPQIALPNGTTQALERRTAALLALLALNGATPRAKAAALVWPEADDPHANNSLRQRIFKLRQIAGRDVIVTDKSIALANDITHDLHAPLARLTADAEACQGDLLGEYDFADCRELDEWIGVARQRWRRELARALADLASRLEGEGRIALALRLGERLIEADSTQEHAHRRVMRLHYLRGDRAAAMNAFDRCRLVLRVELGVLPDAETQELQRLIESSEVPVSRATAPRSSSVLRPPRLIGRSAEWQRLEQAWERGRAMLVVGEAGIGKSRLLTDFASAHAGLVVQARPGDANVPYSTLARLLRALFERAEPPADDGVSQELARVLPELGAPAVGPLSPLRLRLAVETCLRTCVGQELGVLALDDLQFADLASLELLPALAHAARSPTALPRWLLASRPGEMPEPIRAWGAAQDTDMLAGLTLGPLDLHAIEQLLDSLGLPGFDAVQWAPAIARHTGGNPMFILETLRSLWDGGHAPNLQPNHALPLPADVGSLIERRLQQLTPEALNLARLAALAGQDFTPELAASVLERRVIDLAEPWRELEAAQVIRDNAFAHDLILEATQRTVPSAIARALHGAIAQILQAKSGEPARIARHWQGAAAFDAACTSFVAAADAARAVSRLDEELQLLMRADECLQLGLLPGRRPAVLFRALVAAFELGRFAEMRAFAATLEQVASAPLDRLLALEGRMRVQAQDLNFDAMMATFDQAYPLAQTVGTDLQRAFLHSLRASALSRLNRADEAVASLKVGLDWAKRNQDHPWVSGMLVDAAYTLSYLERYGDSAAVARQAYRAAERAGHVRHMHMSSAGVAMLDWLFGDIESSTAEYERCHSLAQRLSGEGTPVVSCGTDLAFCLRMTGRFGEALEHAQAEADRNRKANSGEWWQVWADLELVRGYFELGQLARALAVLGSEPPKDADARFRWLMVCYRVRDTEPAKRQIWIDEMTQLSESGMRPSGKRWTLAPDLCRVLPLADAEEMVRNYCAACRRVGAHMYVRPMQLRLAERLLQAQQIEQALVMAQELVAEARGATPYGLYVPETWWILHRVFAAAGDVSAAADALEAARRWIMETALPHVPYAFRDSFLNRNPINRDVLAAAQRRK